MVSQKILKCKIHRHILLTTYLYDILNSFQIDCVAENELTARINMADAKFSFQEKGKILNIYIIQEFQRSTSLS